MPTGALSTQPYFPETNLSRWLVERGFQKNPFEQINAEYERESLPGYFVEDEAFDALLTYQQPCLVYAGRGCGKTALRQMLAAQCRPSYRDSPILAIHYTYEGFERAYAAAGDNIEKVSASHHVDALLRTGMATFADELVRDEKTLDTLCLHDPTMQVSAYLARYAPDRPIPRIQEGKTDKLDFLTPLELWHGFSRLLNKAGFHSGMVFVDGMDEFLLMDSDLRQSTLFLSHLLGTLPVIECPGLAFKFFLPQDIEPVLKQHNWYRPDRIYTTHLHWSKSRLLGLIQQRLMYFSKRRPAYESLGQLCDDQLASLINEELVELASFQPRAVLRLVDMLFREHASQSVTPQQISIQSWKKAKADWLRQQAGLYGKGPTESSTDSNANPVNARPPGTPSLYIEEKRGLVWFGDTEIRAEMTPKDYQVLVCLYHHVGGVCSKENIANEAWQVNISSAVSDAAIAASIRRIRAVLKKHDDVLEYIFTVRGKERTFGGYRLYPEGKLPDKHR